MLIKTKKIVTNFFIIFICIIPIIGGLGINALFNPLLTWIPSFVLIFISLTMWDSNSIYRVVKIYLIWGGISIIRGFFIAENYWEWRQFFYGIGNVLLPAMVFMFKDPVVIKMILQKWIKWGLPLFCIISFWKVSVSAFHFILAPIFIIGCFIPLLKTQWKIIIIFFIIVMLVGDIGARAQIMKAILVLILSLIVYLRNKIPFLFLKTIHWALYIIPITLLFLGITGKYNIFSESQNKYKNLDNESNEVVLTADTRTFIYKEVIESAVNNNYVLCGRTPARGNDSQVFGALNAEELKTGKYERYMNEVCHPNVFTWLGLLGLIPWCLIYLTSSYLAMYKSNSFFLKVVGIFIAFRFFLGWIEDVNEFSISGLSVWMAIGIGLSPYFRNMDDNTFMKWYKNIFKL